MKIADLILILILSVGNLKILKSENYLSKTLLNRPL
jgi:hypothetical protein